MHVLAKVIILKKQSVYQRGEEIVLPQLETCVIILWENCQETPVFTHKIPVNALRSGTCGRGSFGGDVPGGNICLIGSQSSLDSNGLAMVFFLTDHNRNQIGPRLGFHRFIESAGFVRVPDNVFPVPR